MQVSIIIVSYNVKYFLEQCLYSVRSAVSNLHVEIIVVDNASADSSITYLKPKFPEVIFIASKTNLGFAKACNLGCQSATGQYILFLNPDTLLAENTIQYCLQHFKANPNAGAAGVRMIDGSGRFLKESKRGFPAPLPSLFRLTGLTVLFPHSKLFSAYYLGHLNQHQDHEVEVLAGAFMMVPHAVLKKVGYFDEAFFMYGEDIDLSYRIRLAGYTAHYLAGTTIVHFKGKSTQRNSMHYARLFYGAMQIFVRKYYKGFKARSLSWAISIAIGLHAAVSVIEKGAKLLYQKRSQQTKHSDTLPIAVAGNEKDHALLSMQINNKLIFVKNLEAAANLKEGQRIILCAGTFAYTELFLFMQKCPKPLRYRFQALGSGSAVGSDAAANRGEVLVLKDI